MVASQKKSPLLETLLHVSEGAGLPVFFSGVLTTRPAFVGRQKVKTSSSNVVKQIEVHNIAYASRHPPSEELLTARSMQTRKKKGRIHNQMSDTCTVR